MTPIDNGISRAITFHTSCSNVFWDFSGSCCDCTSGVGIMETRDEMERKRGITALPFSVDLDLVCKSSEDTFILPEDTEDRVEAFLGPDFTGNLTL